MAASDEKNNVCPGCGEKNNPTFSRCWKCGGELSVISLKQNKLNVPSSGPKTIGLDVFAWAVIILGIGKFFYGAVRISNNELNLFVPISITVEAIISIICGVGLLKKRRDFYLLGVTKIITMTISLSVNTVGLFIRLGAPQMLIGLIWAIPAMMAIRDYFRIEGGYNLLLMRFGVIDAANPQLKIKNLFSLFNIISIIILFVALFIEIYI